MIILIKGGRILNPATGMDEVGDVFISRGRIERIGGTIDEPAERVIDATGCWVMPGLIDLHVHFRDPGLTHKESVETGVAAAARGGFTTVLAMPNTKPVADNPDVVSYVHNKAKSLRSVNVLQIGAVTVGQDGEVLSDIEGMVKVGCPAISEDGKSVKNSLTYYKAMELARDLDIPVLAHCEDLELRGNGVLHEGEVSKKLGIPGIKSTVENSIMMRDFMLALDCGARLHLCHCSTKESVKLMRDEKALGNTWLTAEVTPHHFALCDEDVDPANTNYKMNPPLRSRADMEALRQGISEGLFVISTDHAPHSEDEKNTTIDKAPFGIVGLETSAALTNTVLVEGGYITPIQMAKYMSTDPAKVIKLDRGDISEGKIADIAIFNPNAEYEIHGSDFAGKSHNQPYEGMAVKGRVEYTIVDGRVVYDGGKNDR